MSNSKISLSLEVTSGNGPKVVKELGDSFEKSANKAHSLANHISEVASYQEVQADTTKVEIEALKAAKTVQENLRKTTVAVQRSYNVLNRDTKAYKITQTNLNKTTAQTVNAKKTDIHSTNELNQAEEELTSSLKRSRKAARDTKKALDALKSAKTGNYNAAIKLQQSLDREAEKSKEKALTALNAARSSNFEDFAKLQRNIDKGVESSRRLHEQVQQTNSLITGIVGVAVASFSFRGIYEVAQNYIQLSNSFKLVANNGEDVKQTLSDIFNVANESQQPVEATAEAFLTLKKNTAQLGISQKELLGLSSTLSKAIAIGGSSADAAKNSMIQFGQALSLGKLSGQNFNSVAEQTPGLIQAIATGLNMSAADLKNFANSGKLTTELIVKALQTAETQTNETFSKLGVTINGSLNILTNKFAELVGENDFFSQKAAQAILLVANNLGLITAGVGLATAAVVGFKAQNIIKYFYDIGEATQKATRDAKKYAATIDSAGRSFTLASIKEKALLVSTNATRVAIGIATITWRTFNTVVKASVIGAVLTAAVYAIEKFIDGIKWLYQKWKSWQDEIFNADKVVYKTTQAHLTALDLELSQKAKLIEKSKEEIKLLQQKVQLNERGQIVAGANQNQLIAAQLRLKELQNQVATLKAEREKVLKDKAAEDAKKSGATTSQVNSPIVISGAAQSDPNLTAYQNNIKNLTQQVQTAKIGYQNLLQTGKATLSNLDQLNLKLQTADNGYRNLSKAQINKLIELNTQLDQLKENTAFAEQSKKIADQNNLLEFQLSLGNLSEEQRKNAIENYKLEQAIIVATQGMTEEHAKVISEQMRQTIALQDRLHKVQENNANSFANMIKSSIPTWKSFNNMIASDVEKLTDQFAQYVITGKSNFKDMAKSMIKDFVAMTIKAAALTAVLQVGNYVTGGGLTAALKTFGSFSKILGFASGGYTGNIPTNAVAGVVHGQEYVINAESVARYGRSFFDSINSGKLTTTNMHNNQVVNNTNNSVTSSPKITINNHASVDVQPQYNGNELILDIVPRIRKEAYDVAIDVYHKMTQYDN